MELRGSTSLLLLLLSIAWCLGLPVPQDKIDSDVAKRTLVDDGAGVQQLPAFNPFFAPYGVYPGVKPLHPVLPPGIVISRFATPAPLDPIAAFFKNKKDEFLNKLFNDLTAVTDAPVIEVRSAVDGSDLSDGGAIETPGPTTPKPKIDPSVFITKKFDFLAQLFKALNTTTPAPTLVGDSTDPTATTVKPSIVPPGFWVPFPKPPKPPKPSKPPKPEKTKIALLNEIDEALLKAILAEVGPTNPALTDSAKVTREAVSSSKNAVRKASFLDELLHRVTEATPTEPPSDPSQPSLPSSPIETRSLFPPGYWIPPYIYAAKMGIYLDKIFDTIDKAAAADSEDVSEKRSVTETDPSSLILAELTALKNDMVTAFAEGMKSAKTAPASAKPTPKSFKKPFWGPKTTPTPDPVQQRVDLLSDVFDRLAAVEQQLVAGPNATEVATTVPTEPTPSYWAPDPSAPDISAYYKTKTQEFLSQLFADKASAAPAIET